MTRAPRRQRGAAVVSWQEAPTRSDPHAPMNRTLILLAAALLAVLPGTVHAHTRLTGTTPASGDTVPAATREVRLRFSQAPEASMTWLAVLRGTDTIAVGTPVPVPGSQGREFVLALPTPLPGGGYQVAWRTAGADGHVLRGTFGFVVEAPASVPDTAAPVALPPLPQPATPAHEVSNLAPAAWPGVLVRWGWFLALLGMIGAPAFYAGVLDRLRRRGAHERVTARAAYGAWHVAAGAAALSLLTLVLRLWLHSAKMYGAAEALEGARLAALLQTTSWGTAWTLQAVATVGYFLGLMVARAPHGRAAGWMGAGAAALLLAAVPALSGHAAAMEGKSALAILIDTLHVAGAGVWLGTLAVLMAAGLPAALSRADGGSPQALADLVNAFSPVALAGGAVAGGTGVVNALLHLSAASQLWSTGYGRTLALKLLLLLVVAAAGAFNWRRVRPSLADEQGASRLRRSAAAELGAGVLVVLATAVLVALPTP